MSRHTPGPWTVHTADWDAGGNARYVLTGVKELSKGDAMLIAAAPDLLEALCRLLPHAFEMQCSDQTEDDGLIHRDIDRAHAAIAKATGGAA